MGLHGISQDSLVLKPSGLDTNGLELRTVESTSVGGRHTFSIVTFFTTTSLFGLSWRLRGTFTTLSATSWPSTTSPKIVCFPVSHVVGASVMKNCEPFVLGPAFAIASFPGLSNLWGEPLVSSSN